MAHIFADRVLDTSTTTGTGALTLAASPPTGFRTFSAVCSTSDTVYYCIEHQSAAEWEVGLGTYSSANTLTRTTVYKSSNANAAVSFSAGTKNVFVTLAADRTVQLTTTGIVILPAGSTLNGTDFVVTNTAKTESIWIPAAAMTPRTTNGAASSTSESTTNKVMRKTLDFDQSAAEYAQASFLAPKSTNESTPAFKARFVWECGVTGDVVWGAQILALSNDDVIDTAFGTAQTVTDSVTATTDIMMSSDTSAIAPSNSFAEGDMAVAQFYRDATNGSDTAAGDAKLIGVLLVYDTNSYTDA